MNPKDYATYIILLACLLIMAALLLVARDTCEAMDAIVERLDQIETTREAVSAPEDMEPESSLTSQ